MDLIAFLATFLALFVALLQIKTQLAPESLFQTHPASIAVALYSLILCWLLLAIKLSFPRFYLAYEHAVPFSVDLFGSISMASTASLLFPDSAMVRVYLLLLLVPAGKIFYWFFLRFELRFRNAEFWRMWIEPAQADLRRIRDRVFPPVEPLLPR